MDATIPCVCPPRGDAPQHEQDTITFRERLDFRAGLTIRRAIGIAKDDDPNLEAAEVLAILTEHYLIHGIESWTLKDDKGKAVEVTREAIRAFLADYPDEAMEAGDTADDLYAEQVLLPLLRRASNSSQPSPTPKPTSPRTGSQAKRPKPSQRSSTSTTRTEGTGKITSLPAGDSRSSPSSATAA